MRRPSWLEKLMGKNYDENSSTSNKEAKKYLDKDLNILNEKYSGAHRVPLNNMIELECYSLFDSHCHMDFILFEKLKWSPQMSYKTFLEQYPSMKQESLGGFLTNFCKPNFWTHLETPLVKSLLEQNGVFYSVGCHPHYVYQMSKTRLKEMEEVVKKSSLKLCAIGECGLDTSLKNRVPLQKQIELFEYQIHLAMRENKPLILHIRGAEEEALRVLKVNNLPHDWPIHRYGSLMKIYVF